MSSNLEAIYKLYLDFNFGIRFYWPVFLMIGGATAVSVGSFACLLGPSIESGPGEPGKRVFCCRGCVPHYLHNMFSNVFE